MPAASTPLVSIVIPAFRSQATLGRCLEHVLDQDLPPSAGFEVLVIDSSPDDATAAVARRYPAVRLERSEVRLLPHAARNLAIRQARGELLALIDPDVYPVRDWLRTLVAAYEARQVPLVGSLVCHGSRWLDVGVHICKFSKWLPGGAPRAVDMSPTANMLIDRATYDASGGFDGEQMQGDASFSWKLRSAGHTLWFEPRAEVAHHHLCGWQGFLRERYRRGVEFAALRSDWEGHGRGRSLLYLAVSLLPIRFARIVLLVAADCRGAGMLRELVSTAPVWLSGHAASLLGESRTYLRRAIRPARRASGAEQPSPAGRGAGVGSLHP